MPYSEAQEGHYVVAGADSRSRCDRRSHDLPRPPAGRLQRLSTRASALLSATATGILLFLLWDVLSAGIEPVEAALNAAALDHDGTWARFAGLAAIFVGCFAIGLMSLVYFDQLDREAPPARTASAASARPRSPSTRCAPARCRPPSRCR